MKVGDLVDNFKLTDQIGNQFDLYQNLDKHVLLVFYPKDNSLVCTKQLVDYSSNRQELIKYNVKIIGINIEPIESHKLFCNRKNINFPILSDSDKKVSRQFDALNLLGQNKRKLVLMGNNKKIKFVRSSASIFYLNTQQLLEEFKIAQLI